MHTVCSIWPIDRTLSGATTSGLSKPGSNVNERVLHIFQIFKAGVKLSDCLVSYPGHSLEGVLPLCRDAISVFYSPSWLEWITQGQNGPPKLMVTQGWFHTQQLESHHLMQFRVIFRILFYISAGVILRCTDKAVKALDNNNTPFWCNGLVLPQSQNSLDQAPPISWSCLTQIHKYSFKKWKDNIP